METVQHNYDIISISRGIGSIMSGKKIILKKEPESGQIKISLKFHLLNKSHQKTGENTTLKCMFMDFNSFWSLVCIFIELQFPYYDF